MTEVQQVVLPCCPLGLSRFLRLPLGRRLSWFYSLEMTSLRIMRVSQVLPLTAGSGGSDKRGGSWPRTLGTWNALMRSF